MKLLSWNYRGFNDLHSPKFSYLVWLCRTKFPTLLFMCETKMHVDNVVSRLRILNPTSSFRCDVDGSKGGLVVSGWSNDDVLCLHATKHVVVCNILEKNGNSRHVIFVYGKPKVDNRSQVWDTLSSFLDFPKSILIGDFNKLETIDDKLGGSLIIRGSNDLINWRMRNNVMDVPIAGPIFSWSNKCLGEDLILEMLDRAYVTSLWYDEFPEGIIKNEPITVSYHATICYDSSPMAHFVKRSYQLENGCLQFQEVRDLVENNWTNLDIGSSIFKVHKNLRLTRSKIGVCLTRASGV